jgi:hypothetical protein
MGTQGRGFWLHQIVEYVIGIGMLFLAGQSSDPMWPAVLGAAILVNAAMSDGAMSAYRVIPRRVHKVVDWVVIVLAIAASIFADHDAQARVSLLGVGLILAVIALGTNYVGKGARSVRGK